MFGSLAQTNTYKVAQINVFHVNRIPRNQWKLQYIHGKPQGSHKYDIYVAYTDGWNKIW